MLKELARSYMTITKDLTRVMVRLKALYRSWAIPCAGQQVCAPRHRAAWLEKITEAGVYDLCTQAPPNTYRGQSPSRNWPATAHFRVPLPKLPSRCTPQSCRG